MYMSLNVKVENTPSTNFIYTVNKLGVTLANKRAATDDKVNAANGSHATDEVRSVPTADE